MKIKNIFSVETIGEEQFMVCLDSDVLSGMVKLNETAAFIVRCLKEDTTIEEIAQKMSLEYEVNVEDAAIGVAQIVEQLKSINAIEETAN